MLPLGVVNLSVNQHTILPRCVLSQRSHSWFGLDEEDASLLGSLGGGVGWLLASKGSTRIDE